MHTESHKHKSYQITCVSTDCVRLPIAHLLSGCDRHVCHDPSSILPSPCLLPLEESPGGRVQRTGNGWCPALSFRREINYLVNIELLIQKRSSSQVPNVVAVLAEEGRKAESSQSKLHQLSLQLAVLSFQGKDVNQMLPKQVKQNLLLNQNVKGKMRLLPRLASSLPAPLSSVSQ